jgi:hypothetical protein
MTSVVNICGMICFHGCKRLRQEKGGEVASPCEYPRPVGDGHT